jgi:hypothetical protein
MYALAVAAQPHTWAVFIKVETARYCLQTPTVVVLDNVRVQVDVPGRVLFAHHEELNRRRRS